VDSLSYMHYGITNFDNIGSSLLNVFIMITESWYQFLLNMMDADLPIFGAVMSIVVLVFGAFFLMNLIFAVIIGAFIKT
jgi:Ion transport protein